MSDTLETFIKHYVELEHGMRELINRKGNSLCAQCSCICCDVVMCVEAIKSPFLKQVHLQADEFDPKTGFLSETGCKLKKGRPSVCYEYFCDDHFYHQPDDLHADVLKILGTLLYHATHNASHGLPLEDLGSAELDALDFRKLESQLQESLQALDIIRTFYRDGTLSEASHALLKRIRFPEE